MLWGTVAAQQKDTLHLGGVTIKDNRAQIEKQEAILQVQTVNSQFIRRHLGGSLMKTLERVPGIKTIGIGSGQSKPLVRGLGFNRVVVLDKGIKHEGQQWGADHGLELDQFAAGEVELLKGAASFAYGSDAIAGAINVKPVPPPAPHSFGGAVDITGKTNNMLYGGSLNLYGRGEHWWADGRITYQDYADYKVPADTVFVYDYAAGLHKQQLRNTAGNETSLHFNTGYIGDKFRSTFHISNVYSKSGFFANAHGLEPRKVDAAMHDASRRDILLPYQEVNHFKVINRSSYQLQQHQLEMELGYQYNHRQEYSQYVPHGYMPALYPDTMNIDPSLERAFDKQVYSFNLRDNITIGQHTLMAGVSGERQENKIGGWGFLVPAFVQHNAGAFVYDKFRLNSKVILHGAIRYDYGEMQMQQYTDWFYSNDEKLVRADKMRRSFNSVVWSAGVNYNLERLSLKGNVGKSFRMPIAKELAANGVNYHYFSYERGNASLSPEESYQVDASVGWEDENWSITFTPFYNYFPNYIYLNPTSVHDYYYGAGNQVFEYEQSRVVRYGTELQMKYNILPSLSTEVLGEYLYSQQVSGDKEGYTLPFSPPPSVLINLSYSPAALPQSYISLDYRITAAQNRIVPPEKKTPGYRLLHLQAGTPINIRKQPLVLSLQVQNVLNTRYMEHTSFYRLLELPEAGRNIVLSVKIPFSNQQR